MTDIEDKPPCIAERYARATHSANLTPSFEHRTDADILLAAGIAVAGDEKMALALRVYRLRLASSTEGLHEIVKCVDVWLLSRLRGRRPMPRPARQALLMDVLQWWIRPTCTYCGGTCFVAVEDTGRLSTQECGACHGTGQRPLARAVPKGHVGHAFWLVDRLDQQVLLIQAGMARLLNERMDLTL